MIQEAIDHCLCYSKYDELEAYLSDLLEDEAVLFLNFEREVSQRIRNLGIEEMIAGYAFWNPYVKDYTIEEISNFESIPDCLVSILRIIYYKKGDFTQSWIRI
jgi:hypothetical protein